ncbi:hypothetical protein [Haematospirillum jordaniae]|uniref:hypothetical protein n=1 Tax=Haematospirillum jordaniae TaxID=1549855 RepID=UPI001432C25E|nr:hypothetical protein [Haematospirillum jordaniae]NKD46307.1 hypothetical protein [Haematospirillum jordaniae]NKD82351.1 hypothetical protein [Haematospirillum jordaniae]NKD84478.1 hypothetical protein [Haematospirillum jordaniae]
MFPVTITLHDSVQLAAVLTALEKGTTARLAAANGNPEIIPRKAKAEKALPNKVAVPEKTDISLPPEPEATDDVTYQQVADAVTKLVKTKGRDIAVGVLERFGAAKLPDVKPDQYAAVLAACQEAEGV